MERAVDGRINAPAAFPPRHFNELGQSMTTILGALRRKAMTPPLDDVLFSKRGFRTSDEAARDLLEMSGRQFVIGYGFAMESADTREAVTMLQTLEHDFLGFAYEGAAMALALRDALRPGPRGRRNEDFLRTGRGAAHIYMAYLGIGFALARLPRMLWSRALPDVSRLPDHPTLAWFIWDGYGFHQAFFNPKKWINQQHVGTSYPWPTRYVNRAIDHGIGRALWFYNGGNVEGVAKMINDFPSPRHADLWSGAGLAASYAGGTGADGLRALKDLAGTHHAEVALGAVLGIKARVLADTVNPHTEVASEVLCGMTAAEAAEITNRVVIDLPPDGDVPAYEVFRDRIRQHFVTSPDGSTPRATAHAATA